MSRSLTEAPARPKRETTEGAAQGGLGSWLSGNIFLKIPTSAEGEGNSISLLLFCSVFSQISLRGEGTQCRNLRPTVAPREHSRSVPHQQGHGPRPRCLCGSPHMSAWSSHPRPSGSCHPRRSFTLMVVSVLALLGLGQGRCWRKPSEIIVKEK